MLGEGNKELARRFMDEVWNKGNVDFTADCSDVGPTAPLY